MDLRKNETRLFWPIIGLVVYVSYIIIDHDLNARNQTRQESLITQIESKDRVERMIAVRTLGEVRPSTREIRQALTNALLDEDKAIRIYAAEYLRDIGPIASESVKVLKFMTREADEDIQKAAREALDKIEPIRQDPAAESPSPQKI